MVFTKQDEIIYLKMEESNFGLLFAYNMYTILSSSWMNILFDFSTLLE